MKVMKKVFALLLAVAMILSLAACHPKNEVAVSSGDVKITSAMYSYYLVMADMEAQNVISEDESIDTTAEGFDYHKQQIEGKSYSDYVKEKALQHCLKAIAYQKLCQEKGLELSTDDIANADYMAQYNWYYYGYNYGYQYGYGDFLPLNGVGYDTYAAVTKINYYGDVYFKNLYDEGGEKAVPAEDIDKAFDENYAGVYIISESYTDETLTEVKETLTGYLNRLKDGEEFKTIYDEHNDTQEQSETTEEESEESDTPKPKDELITVVGSEETEGNYQFSKFADVKSMVDGEVKLIEDTDNKAFYLVVKKDLKSDEYYKETLLASDILYLIKGDEFSEMVDGYIAQMEYDVSKFAINQFKVKNISYGA